MRPGQWTHPYLVLYHSDKEGKRLDCFRRYFRTILLKSIQKSRQITKILGGPRIVRFLSENLTISGFF